MIKSGEAQSVQEIIAEAFRDMFLAVAQPDHEQLEPEELWKSAMHFAAFTEERMHWYADQQAGEVKA